MGKEISLQNNRSGANLGMLNIELQNLNKSRHANDTAKPSPIQEKFFEANNFSLKKLDEGNVGNNTKGNNLNNTELKNFNQKSGTVDSIFESTNKKKSQILGIPGFDKQTQGNVLDNSMSKASMTPINTNSIFMDPRKESDQNMTPEWIFNYGQKQKPESSFRFSMISN